ncbi:MAG: UDP-N-acetylglucosamine 2-epimerase (non-hydrolyzing) [Patescibacteria group bacterium]|jgi:UDP-N-acetylglucosamine 2-epimerase (non-hydrolysing)
MKIVSVVGARPQFIKLAPLSKQLKKKYNEIIIHTGQHYDIEMSQNFFDTLQIPKPNINLNIGSATHGEQTARMLEALEKNFIKIRPSLVIVYGDTNTTMAGALAAAKLHIPIAHIESGMRSFNKHMPEEINRIVTDHVSDLLFCSTQQPVQWLMKENITENVFMVGDLMIDALRNNVKIASKKSKILNKFSLQPKTFNLATIHRAENTDDKKRLKKILTAIIRSNYPTIFPIHPRTRKMIHLYGLQKLLTSKTIIPTEPIGYFDMLVLEKNAHLILTDSGGVQKEAFFFKTPCITMRDETEWVETTKQKWNILSGANEKIITRLLHTFPKPKSYHPVYGDGKTASKILEIINNWFSKK